MHELVIGVSILQVEGLGTGPDVPFFKKITLPFTVDQDPYPNIKFSSFHEHWLFDILLNDEITTDDRLFEDFSQLFKFAENLDSPSSIQLTRLDDPQVLVLG